MTANLPEASAKLCSAVAALAAFSDRFLVRVFGESIDDPQLETLLESGWKPFK
jgi:hypothetical protein